MLSSARVRTKICIRFPVGSSENVSNLSSEITDNVAEDDTEIKTGSSGRN